MYPNVHRGTVYNSQDMDANTSLIAVTLLHSLKSGSLQTTFFFFKIALAIGGLLCFPTHCEIFCSSSVKLAIGILTGIALNL